MCVFDNSKQISTTNTGSATRLCSTQKCALAFC